MAQYRFGWNPIKRSEGRSVVAAIAYRVGDRIHDDRLGTTYDYTRRSGVAHVELMLPTDAPEWARSATRSGLWNEAERRDKRHDARPAVEVLLSLPHELDRDDQVDICRQFTRELIDQHNVAADFALHLPDRKGDQRNFHTHLVISTSRLAQDGFGKKAEEFSQGNQGSKTITRWRKRWEEIQNEKLIERGIDARVDCRSHKDRGTGQTPGEHDGPEFRKFRKEIESDAAIESESISKMPDPQLHYTATQLQDRAPLQPGPHYIATRHEYKTCQADVFKARYKIREAADTLNEYRRTHKTRAVLSDLFGIRWGEYEQLHAGMQTVRREHRHAFNNLDPTDQRVLQTQARVEQAKAIVDNYRREHWIVADAHDKHLIESTRIVELESKVKAAEHEHRLAMAALMKADRRMQQAARSHQRTQVWLDEPDDLLSEAYDCERAIRRLERAKQQLLASQERPQVSRDAPRRDTIADNRATLDQARTTVLDAADTLTKHIREHRHDAGQNKNLPLDSPNLDELLQAHVDAEHTHRRELARLTSATLAGELDTDREFQALHRDMRAIEIEQRAPTDTRSTTPPTTAKDSQPPDKPPAPPDAERQAEHPASSPPADTIAKEIPAAKVNRQPQSAELAAEARAWQALVDSAAIITRWHDQHPDHTTSRADAMTLHQLLRDTDLALTAHGKAVQSAIDRGLVPPTRDSHLERPLTQDEVLMNEGAWQYAESRLSTIPAHVRGVDPRDVAHAPDIVTPKAPVKPPAQAEPKAPAKTPDQPPPTTPKRSRGPGRTVIVKPPESKPVDARQAKPTRRAPKKPDTTVNDVPAPTQVAATVPDSPTKSNKARELDASLQNFENVQTLIVDFHLTHASTKDLTHLQHLAELLDDEDAALAAYTDLARALPKTHPARPQRAPRLRRKAPAHVLTELDAKDAQRKRQKYLDDLQYDDPAAYHYETVTRPRLLREAAEKRRAKAKDPTPDRGGPSR